MPPVRPTNGTDALTPASRSAGSVLLGGLCAELGLGGSLGLLVSVGRRLTVRRTVLLHPPWPAARRWQLPREPRRPPPGRLAARRRASRPLRLQPRSPHPGQPRGRPRPPSRRPPELPRTRAPQARRGVLRDLGRRRTLAVAGRLCVLTAAASSRPGRETGRIWSSTRLADSDRRRRSESISRIFTRISSPGWTISRGLSTWWGRARRCAPVPPRRRGSRRRRRR